jgi:DNA-binding HxlR family transcriptional regulator
MTTATLRMTGELDPRDGWTAGGECTIAKSVELLSARSAFLLMREAFYGATRFEEFVRRAELSEPAASARLHELVEQGLLELEPY